MRIFIFPTITMKMMKVMRIEPKEKKTVARSESFGFFIANLIFVE
jgi:hypothetical protein